MMDSHIHKLAIILIVVISSLFLLGCTNRSQENRIEELSQKYCSKLVKLDANRKSNHGILEKMILAGSKLGQENKVLSYEIKQAIANRLKSKNEKDIAYTFATDFVSDLLETCPTYSKLVRLQLPKLRKENETIIYVSERIKDFVENWQNLPLPEIYDRATDSIITNLGYASSSYRDYGSIDVYLMEPLNDIHMNLLHTSDIYFKSFLANEQLRAMGAEAKKFPMGVQRKWNFSEID